MKKNMNLIGSATLLALVAVIIRSLSGFNPGGFSGGLSVGLLIVSAVTMIFALARANGSEGQNG